MNYINDEELNEVLENYFDSIEESDKETIEKEMTKDGLESIEEGLGSYLEERKRKDLEKISTKMDNILKENKYKYYVVEAINTYDSYGTVYRYTTFKVYGSNIRAFSRKDHGIFRTWKKDLEAKKLGKFKSYYTNKIEKVPANIRKYIL